MNAILNYRGSRHELEKSKIYVDLFPCNECAKLIIQSGIKEIIYVCDKSKDTISEHFLNIQDIFAILSLYITSMVLLPSFKSIV